MKKILYFICILLLSSHLYAQAVLDQNILNGINNIQRTIKNNDIVGFSQLFKYPINQAYPLKPIKNALDFIESINYIIDDDLISEISDDEFISNWSDVGWRGYTYKNGTIWLDFDGEIRAINYTSKAKKEILHLFHSYIRTKLTSSYSDLTDIAGIYRNKNFTIMIDNTPNGIRYSSWKTTENLWGPIELTIKNGTYTPEGQLGDGIYEFTNIDYKYCIEERNENGGRDFNRYLIIKYKDEIIYKELIDLFYLY